MAHTITRNRRHLRGFTLVELLVVTLILSILMAVALPLYISAVKDSHIKTNRVNMHSVATAVQAAYVLNQSAGYSVFSGPATSAKEPDLNPLPIGPNGETYSVAVPGPHGGAFVVSCSDSSAGTFEPGYDNK